MVSRLDTRAAAEAAVWLARLQGDVRTPERETAFREWLRADPAHRYAFEKATDIWAEVPDMVGAEPEVTAPKPRQRAPLYALAAMLVAAIAVAATLWILRPAAYSTRVGEQKVATLEDGSRIALNTDSSVEVRYDAKERLVQLDRGEAMFEVAHNSARPFLVRAGDKQIRAVGTAFVVRREANAVTVTLLHGKVAVTDVRSGASGSAPTYLNPGDRLRAPAAGQMRIDVQPLEAATAWRRGQAVFADTPLPEAIAEMNRYGGPRLILADPALGSLRVSGVFATNDTGEFARAVAALHALHVAEDGKILWIVRQDDKR
ncbi:transmembrane sensor [Sphingomonas trueperi]|uniref:FecR family protein n=1 Tax=Sphingomonas trueperi TaxID=53317 RepID=UPI0033996E05